MFCAINSLSEEYILKIFIFSKSYVAQKLVIPYRNNSIILMDLFIDFILRTYM